MNIDTHAGDLNRLNWKQACELLGCKKTKFYLLIKNGTITAYKTGTRGLWVKREDCEKLLQSSLAAHYEQRV